MGDLGKCDASQEPWANSPFRPYLQRYASVELISQALGSAMLASVMRAPVGTALLVSFMGRSYGQEDHSDDAAYLGLLIISNFIAVCINPLSGLGNVYTDAVNDLPSPPPKAEGELGRDEK